MKAKILLFALIIALSPSCVSKKIYDDLEQKYNRLTHSNSELIDQNEALVVQKNKLQSDLKNLSNEIQELNDRKVGLENEYTSAKNRLEQLLASYDALQTESATEISKNAQTIRDLLKELEQKENLLTAESQRLSKLQTELNDRTQTIQELEQLIATKEAKMNALKNAVSNALKGFEGKGLTVTHKNGKVYVSMENKLLFDSGSWAVGMQGGMQLKN